MKDPYLMEWIMDQTPERLVEVKEAIEKRLASIGRAVKDEGSNPR